MTASRDNGANSGGIGMATISVAYAYIRILGCAPRALLAPAARDFDLPLCGFKGGASSGKVDTRISVGVGNR